MKTLLLLFGFLTIVSLQAATTKKVSYTVEDLNLVKEACAEVVYGYYDYDSDMGDLYCGDLVVYEEIISSGEIKRTTIKLASFALADEEETCYIKLTLVPSKLYVTKDGDFKRTSEKWTTEVVGCESHN